MKNLLDRAVDAFKGKLRRAIERDDSHATQIMTRVLSPRANCVDVGCNAGQILRHMVRLAPAGRHHAFEALPHLAKRVAREFPGVIVIQAAASDENGRTTFRHVVNDAGYSGMRERRYDRSDPKIEVIEVPMKRLDDVLPKDLDIRFVKIDVEGAELQVLRGAQRILKNQRPYVLFEHGRGASEFYGTTPEMVYQLLVDECGLRISHLAGWLAGQAPIDRAALRASYDAGAVWNFLAHP